MNERELSLTGALHKEFVEYSSRGEDALTAKLCVERGPWTWDELSNYLTRVVGIPEKVAKDLLDDFTFEHYLVSDGVALTSGLYGQVP